MTRFKGTHYPKDVILYAVFFYVHYSVSYRDLEEILEKRSVDVDHATLNRWVVRYAPMMGFKAFHSAAATLEGIETAHMIRKGLLRQEGVPAWRQFMALAG